MDCGQQRDASSQMLEVIDRRCNAIERRLRGESSDPNDPIERVKDHCQRAGVYSVRYKWVMPNYYERPLEERAKEMGCKPEQLCKTMIMENKGYAENNHPNGGVDASDPLSSKYYMVVVQYIAKLSPQKLSAAVMKLKPAGERLSRAQCNLQVAPEEVGLELSGFPHNGVSVFGGLSPLPVIVSEAIMPMRPACIWMGGGHPVLKLGIDPVELVDRLGVIVADISVPRLDVRDNGAHDGDQQLECQYP